MSLVTVMPNPRASHSMRAALSSFFCFLLCCGCASRTPQVGVAEPTLAPGDCIIVDSGAHRQGLETRHVVDASGDISLTLLGKFHVAGLTLRQTESRLEKEYVDRGLFSHVDLVVLPYP